MQKTIICVLLALVVLMLGLNYLKDSKEEATLGLAIYNNLGYSGMAHATSAISNSIATGTTHTVMSANPARMYARIRNDTVGDYFTIQFTTVTLETPTTTPVFASGNLVKGNGIFLDPGEEYTIGPDNLWIGHIVAIASSTATATLNYIEK